MPIEGWGYEEDYDAGCRKGILKTQVLGCQNTWKPRKSKF